MSYLLAPIPRQKLLNCDARICAVALRVILAALVLRRSPDELPSCRIPIIKITIKQPWDYYRDLYYTTYFTACQYFYMKNLL